MVFIIIYLIVERKINEIRRNWFYTLSNRRAIESSIHSPLYRCELIITPRCNFKCPYCRGTKAPEIKFKDALKTLEIWCSQGLKNVRFSGGEPTLYNGLKELVEYCKYNNVERIAISTNGIASIEYYDKLLEAGVNDFSISLDALCCSIGDIMAGNIKNSWEHVCDVIRYLSKKTYVTTGMVFNETNISDYKNAVKFAISLGVSDVRIISSAQYNKSLVDEIDITNAIEQYPILKYRLSRIKNNLDLRGLNHNKSNRCKLVVDDMLVAGNYHYPCVIYFREGGKPIGKVDDNMRVDRYNWFKNHDIKRDSICKNQCLDVCVDYNMMACSSNLLSVSR